MGINEMMKTTNTLQDMKDEIRSRILSDLKNDTNGKNSIKKESIWQMLIDELSTQVVNKLKRELSMEDLLEDKRIEINNKNTEEGLTKAEEKLEKINRKLSKEQAEDEDEDEIKDTDSNYPNLKYARPKYKNLESVLKYIESKDDNGGVKLIIMNFND